MKLGLNLQTAHTNANNARKANNAGVNRPMARGLLQEKGSWIKTCSKMYEIHLNIRVF